MANCAALGCNHSHRNCSLFRFPTDIARRKLWIKNCRRPFATTTHRLCKHHFRKNLFRMKGNRRVLAKNAVPTIFTHTNSQKKNENSSQKKMKSHENKENSMKTSNCDAGLRIAECWSEQHMNKAKKELLSVIYEDSNPLSDDPMIPAKRSINNLSLGLENIPIIGSDVSNENSVEFSYSTPKKLNVLTPILEKWSPKINSVVSIIEDLIDSSDDDEDNNNGETGSNHVIYIDEDLVKQEEFVDENSEENSDYESCKISENDEEKLSCSFDEKKVQKQFHITDTLRVKLPKINLNSKYINNQPSNSTSQSKFRKEVSSKRKSSGSSSKKRKLAKKSSSKTSSKTIKTSQSSQRCKVSNSTVKSKRSTPTEPKSPRKTQIHSNQRTSLRLSGKSPEIKLPEYVPSITRSGKKRIYEEPKSRSNSSAPVYTIDEEEISNRISRTVVKKEPDGEDISRSRSPSPSKYKRKIEVLFVCQCCDEKYASIEQVKAHIRTHFPHCATN